MDIGELRSRLAAGEPIGRDWTEDPVAKTYIEDLIRHHGLKGYATLAGKNWALHTVPKWGPESPLKVYLNQSLLGAYREIDLVQEIVFRHCLKRAGQDTEENLNHLHWLMYEDIRSLEPTFLYVHSWLMEMGAEARSDRDEQEFLQVYLRALVAHGVRDH